jgi:hypothetical protein
MSLKSPAFVNLPVIHLLLLLSVSSHMEGSFLVF